MADDCISEPDVPTLPDLAPRWRLLTKLGNERLARGDWAGALSSYAQARELALAQFGRWAVADDAIAAIVVSYLNLSEAQLRLELIDEAASTLGAVHGGLRQMARDPEIGCELQRSAHKHLAYTHAALLRFEEHHGERAEFAPWLQRGCTCAAHAQESTALPAVSSRTLH